MSKGSRQKRSVPDAVPYDELSPAVRALVDTRPSFEDAIRRGDAELERNKNATRLKEIFIFHQALVPSSPEYAAWIEKIDAHIVARMQRDITA